MGVWAYSVDLRERVVRAFEVGEMTDHEVVALFGIGEATFRDPKGDGPQRPVGRGGLVHALWLPGSGQVIGAFS